jgi:hypothetical protein
MSIYRKFDREPSNDVHAARVKADSPKKTSDATEQRKGAPAVEPLPSTMTWVAKLPRDIRPLALLRAFPRIANALAANWTDPAAFLRCVDELFVDRRGGRKGFPPDVMGELFALRTYYEGLHPTDRKRWDIANKRD